MTSAMKVLLADTCNIIDLSGERARVSMGRITLLTRLKLTQLFGSEVWQFRGEDAYAAANLYTDHLIGTCDNAVH
jgi:hypothetical protein